MKSNISTISDIGRTVICIDIATSNLAIDIINLSELIKTSGLKKSLYVNTKRTFEKLLNINSTIGINEICVQLGLSEVKKLSAEILEKYKQYINRGQILNEDLSHPQYAAMAVYFGCKKLKVKPPKQKLLPFSHLKPIQWTILEKEFEKV